ncbi:diguanylate cyclase domain-containing protein [Magnetococcales bacterium HHB-1]
MAKILIVDDDGRTVELMAQYLKDAGYEPDFLLESKWLFPKLDDEIIDLILLDISMPDIDGLTLLDRLKNSPKTADIPVIMVTGNSHDRVIEDSFSRGANDFVRKPVEKVELISRIRTALAASRHIQEIKEQNIRIRQNKEFVETVLHSMEEGICVLDGNFTVLEANRVFLSKISRTREEIVGRKCFNELTKDSGLCDGCMGHDAIECLVRETLETGACMVRERRHEDEEGNPLYTKVITTPIQDANGRTYQVIYITRDITQRKILEERLRHLAFHDTLTGLPNRQLFYDRLEQSLEQGQRQGKGVAILFFDLDKFKGINDTLGHDAGDELLRQVAMRIGESVRKTDTVARLGGDEFTAIMTNFSSVEDVRHMARKNLDNLSQPFDLKGEVVEISASIGISLFPYDGREIDILMKKADQALYKVKGSGRGSYHFHSEPQEALQTYFQSY